MGDRRSNVNNATDTTADVLHSDEALQTAARLLGIHNVNELLEQPNKATDDAFEHPRPQGLGLGAKFLPHNKAVGLVGGVRSSLTKRLRTADAQHGAQKRDNAGQHHEEEEEELQGRAGAFGGGKNSSSRGVKSLKQQLVDEASAGPSKKRKKKKKHGGGD